MQLADRNLFARGRILTARSRLQGICGLLVEMLKQGEEDVRFLEEGPAKGVLRVICCSLQRKVSRAVSADEWECCYEVETGVRQGNVDGLSANCGVADLESYAGVSVQ